MSDQDDRKKVPLEVPKAPGDETDAEREARLERERKTGKDELIQRQKDATTKPTETTKEDLQKKEDLSEEDKKLKENLEMLVQRVVEPGNSAELRRTALTALSTEIRSSTSSMTALPKPLKFLRQHYDSLRASYDHADSADVRPYLSDVLSVLAMVNGKPAKRETLKFRLLGSQEDVGSWGHEYVRHVATELAREFESRMQADENSDNKDLVLLLNAIIPFYMKHNAEVDACDLLMEVDMLPDIVKHVTGDNVVRVCSYLIACTDYASDQEERLKHLEVVYNSYMAAAHHPDALRVAMRMHDTERINAVIAATKDLSTKKQLAYILGSQRVVSGDFDDDALKDIMGNTHMHAKFVELARDLGVSEPKTLEDVYKTHLAESGAARRQRNPPAQKVDSAKQNLAGTFVNAFVNIGYGKDALLTQENSDWLYKNKDHGMLSAAASLGAIMLWDMDTGFSSIDKYSFSTNPYIKAGSLLATGMISCGVTSELDAGFALLSEHVEDRKDPNVAIAAAFGLGLGYAGKERAELYELLVPVVVDNTRPLEVSAMAALSLGLIFAGSANMEVCTAIVESFADRTEKELSDAMARLMCLAVGLLYIGHPENLEVVLATFALIQSDSLRKYAEVTLTSCAHFGTGHVEEIQKLLTICSERAEETKEEKEAKLKAAADGSASPMSAAMAAMGDVPPLGAAGGSAGAGAAPAGGLAAGAAAGAAAEAKEAKESKEPSEEDEYKTLHQAVACLGVTMIASGEEIGSQMALRSIDNLMQYCDINVRRAIPLALGMNSVSRPHVTVIDTLSKLSHDSDEQISQNAIFSLGLVGAGTNNSRIANLLRQLAVYYAKDANHLFISRIAQGLLHMGKGLMTLDPFHSENLLCSPVSVAGLLILLHCALDMKNTFLSHRHYLLFSAVPAVRPRALMTIDEDGKPLAVKVRVGQIVDTVGQAGKPKSITGFQTHDTPIVINKGDRAELDSDEYIPLSTVLEGIVVMRKNPDAKT